MPAGTKDSFGPTLIAIGFSNWLSFGATGRGLLHPEGQLAFELGARTDDSLPTQLR